MKPGSGDRDAAKAARMAQMREFSRRLQRALVERGWSQTDLARASDVSRDRISRYIGCHETPRPETLFALSRALDMQPEDMMPGLSPHKVSVDRTSAADFSIRNNADGTTWIKIERTMPKHYAHRLALIMLELEKHESENPPSAE